MGMMPDDGFVEFRKEEIEQSVPARFEQQVVRYPDRIAVKTKRHRFTYRALNEYANRIAQSVLRLRAEAEEPAALLFSRGTGMVAALLGVSKAGKIVVPLDPSHPEVRLASILEDSQARLIVTHAESLPLAKKLAVPGTALVDIDALDPDLSTENLNLPISPDDLFRIGYTSGSTGSPKGVAQNHRNFLHAVMRYTNVPGISARDRLALLASQASSAGMAGTFRALLNGAALLPFDIRRDGLAKLADWLIREEITIYHSASSVFRNFCEGLSGAEQFPYLRFIHLGGEPVARREMELHQRHFPSSCVLLNNMGGTETGPYRQYLINKDTPITGNVVPVGYAVPDMDVLILDDAGNEVGSGEIGEIAVKSRYLALGYWRNPDLTRERFRPGPGGERIYLTGDLGRLRPDGCLVYLGRKDLQVKIRGNWVEIAEVEMALVAHSYVKDAAVAVRGGGTDREALVAYVVPREMTPVEASELRSFLMSTLPKSMVPTIFVFLRELPLTSNGKVDRMALVSLETDRLPHDRGYVAPVETAEHQLTRIWEDLLGVRPIGIRDDFFSLGGNSLLAVRMMDQVEQTLGKRLPPDVLFTEATIERLAKALVSQNPPDLIVNVQPGSAKPPFFFLHGDLRGGGFYCLNLARGLGEEQPFYALTIHGLDGGPIPTTIEERAASYLKTVRAVQPEGPYFLGGLCNGGVTAFEMARQLQQEGERVALLALLAASGVNARFRLLHMMVTRVGCLFGLRFSERALLFRALRDRCIRTEHRWLNRLARLKALFSASLAEHIARARRMPKRAYWRLARVAASPRRRHEASNDERRLPAGESPHDEVVDALHVAMCAYVPKRYRGRVTLIWPNEVLLKRPHDPTEGWGRVASEVKIHTVPGGYTTAITSHVDALAGILRACLREAQEAIS